MSDFVLDASALLAVLRAEPGADFVVAHARGALMSSVNIAEVFSHTDIRRSSRHRVEAAINAMHIREVPFDHEQAEILASIYPKTLGSSVGFADRACLALAVKYNIAVLTGDTDWLKHDVGIDIQLFRNCTE